MSNTALLERPTLENLPARHLRAVTGPVRTVETPAAPARPVQPERNLPAGTAPRGFALYVGIDETKAAASGVNLGVLVDALRRTLAELAPTAETYATVAYVSAPGASSARVRRSASTRTPRLTPDAAAFASSMPT